VPAGELERVVVEQLIGWLSRDDAISLDGSSADVEVARVERRTLAKQLEQGSLQERRALLLDRNSMIELGAGMIRISQEGVSHGTCQSSRATIEVVAKFVDRGSDVRLMIAPDGSGHVRKPDAVLLKLVMHAFAARDAILSGKADALISDYSPLHQSRLARLSYLAPDIVSAILEGRQPPSLSGRRLLRAAHLSYDWQGQRVMLGFA